MSFRAPIPQVQERPLGTPNVAVDTRGTQGEQLGQALQQVGGNVDRIAQVHAQAMRRENVIGANKAITEWEQRQTTRLYGDKSRGLKGVLEAEGEGAFEAAYGPRGADGQPVTGQTIYDHLLKDREDIARTLGTDEQRELFDEHVQKSMLSVQRQVEAHVSNQARVAQDRTAEARANIELQKVANTFADPETREEAIAAGADALAATALSKDDATNRVMKFRQQAAKVVIAQYLTAGDVKTARAYFATTKELLGTDAAQLQHTIAQAGKDEAAETAAIDIVKRARTGLWVNDEAAFAMVDTLPAGVEKDEVRQRLTARLQAEQHFKGDTIGKVFDRAYSSYLTAGTLRAVDPTDKAWLIANSPEHWDRLRMKARADADHYRVSSERGGRERTDAEVNAYGQLLLELQRTPDTYLQMGVPEFATRWMGKLHDDDYRSGLAKFAQLHGDKEQAAKDKSAVQMLSTVKDSFQGAFGLPDDAAKWTDQQRQTFAHVIDYVDAQEKTYRKQNNGKAPGAEQYQQWATEKLVKGTVIGTGKVFDDKVTRAEAETLPAYKGKDFRTDDELEIEKHLPQMLDLPDVGQDAVKRILKAKGLEPTAENVQKLLSETSRRMKKGGSDPTVDALAAYLQLVAPKPPPVAGSLFYEK